MSEPSFIECQSTDLATTPRDCGGGGRHGASCPPRPQSRGVSRSSIFVSVLAILLLALLRWFDPADARLPLCAFRAVTGLDCPGCGATRATHELLHGRLLAALHYNALWVVLLPLAVYMVISEARFLAGGRPLPGNLPRRSWFWISAAVIAAAFFLVRNLPWTFSLP
jgi:hypothetical protein